MTATISGSNTSTLVALTTTGNTILGDASTDTLNVGNGGLVKDASGNVGIGTSSPLARLHVARSDASPHTLFSGTTKAVRIGTDVDGSVVEGVDATGVSSYQPLSVGGSIVRVTTSGTERARIDPSGNLLVGTTATTPNPGVSIAPAGNITVGNTAGGTGFEFHTFRRSATQIGSITQSGTTAVAYNTSSDYRLKENIAPMTGALATVAALKPCTYKWKSDGSDGQGFIAHELQEVVPDCVTGEKDGVDSDGSPKYQGIDTSFLVATLTAAMQEQQAIITSLTDRITALENK